MKVKDVMTWNVVTVPSDTPIMEARKIMTAHNFTRIPVVDRGKLVGLISKERIARAGPSAATSLSVWELNYLLAKMTVKDVMRKDIVTVKPDTTVEAAIAKAQKQGTGSLCVMENNNLVGIVTTNDFFYRILNPILGIGQPGTRITIANCDSADCMKKVMECLGEHGDKIISIHNEPPVEGRNPGLYVHIDADDVEHIIKDLTDKGFTADVRSRQEE